MSRQIRYVQVISATGGHYFAGSDGSIIRIRELKPSIGKQGRGYAIVAIFDSSGRKVYRTIHSIIAECFVGPRPKGLSINHKDGNRWNNSADNLEYVTPSYNTKHAFLLGLMKVDHAH